MHRTVRRPHPVTIVLLVAALLLTVPLPALAQVERTDRQVDLAAAVLSPLDLEAAGLPGFDVERGRWVGPEIATQIVANALDGRQRDFEDAFVEDDGFVRGYANDLSASAEGGDSLTTSTLLAEFEDADGAEGAFAAITGGADDSIASDRIAGSYGDQSASYGWGDLLVVLYRVDRVVGLTLLDSQAMGDEVYAGIMAARLSQMTTRSVQNVEADLAGQGDRFGLTALRFDEEEPERIPGTDRYFVRDGTFLPMVTMDPTYVEFLHIQADSFGMLTGYERFVYPTNDVDALVQLGIIRHRTPELAASYVNFTKDRLDFGGGYSLVRSYETDRLPGTYAQIFTYTWEFGEQRQFVHEGVGIAVQIDDITITLEVDGPEGIDPEEVIAIAEAQIECIATGECPVVPYPGT